MRRRPLSFCSETVTVQRNSGRGASGACISISGMPAPLRARQAPLRRTIESCGLEELWMPEAWAPCAVLCRPAWPWRCRGQRHRTAPWWHRAAAAGRTAATGKGASGRQLLPAATAGGGRLPRCANGAQSSYTRRSLGLIEVGEAIPGSCRELGRVRPPPLGSLAGYITLQAARGQARFSAMSTAREFQMDG